MAAVEAFYVNRGKTAANTNSHVLIVCATDVEARHVLPGLTVTPMQAPRRGDDTLTAAGEITSSRDEVAAAATLPKSKVLGKWEVTAGWRGAVPVLVLVTSIGSVHAAAGTTAALIACVVDSVPRASEGATDEVPWTHTGLPRAIFTVGCAGAHRSELAVGDVVVGTACVPLDACRVVRDGTREPDGVRTTFSSPHELPRLDADPLLLAAADIAADRHKLPPWPVSASSDETPPAPKVMFGRVGSSDRFTQFAPHLRDYARDDGTVCEEMEAAAVAQAATLFNVPCLAVKDISNNELNAYSGHWKKLPHVAEQLGLRAAMFVLNIVDSLNAAEEWARAGAREGSGAAAAVTRRPTESRILAPLAPSVAVAQAECVCDKRRTCGTSTRVYAGVAAVLAAGVALGYALWR